MSGNEHLYSLRVVECVIEATRMRRDETTIVECCSHSLFHKNLVDRTNEEHTAYSFRLGVTKVY